MAPRTTRRPVVRLAGLTGAALLFAPAALATPAAARSATAPAALPAEQLAAPASAPLDAAAAETQLAGMINDLRAQRGLPPLQFDPVLVALARERSRDM